MKLSIIYHSVTGNTKTVAGLICDAANEFEEIDAKSMSIDDVDEKHLNESSAVLFGCPTYAGSLSWQMKKFIDTVKVKIGDKLGGVFATANFFGGGSEFAEMVMVSALLSRGMIVYSSGVSKGKPFTHFGPVTIKDGNETQQERVKIFGKRFAEKAIELFHN